MTAGAVSRALGEHVAGLSAGQVPSSALHAAKRSLLDGIGVMLAATTLGDGVAAFDFAVPGAGGSATLIGRGRRAEPLAAALANGALAHALDYEDSHDGAPVHPNAALIPAVLALAEARGPVSGQALLVALAVGCDLTCRLGLALRDDPARFGWYPPPILGAFGAAAGAARILGLDAAATVDAFSLLLCSHTCTAELKHSPFSHVRAVRDAFAAQAGAQAALLAAGGVRGFDAPIEGQAGLYAVYAGGAFDRDALLDGLGTRFEGERLSYKPWPSCRATHPFIEAAILARQAGIAPAAVAAIRLIGHPIVRMLDEPREQKRRPRTAIDAKFSLPYTVAIALLDEEIVLESFASSALGRPEVAALAERVEVEVDPSAAPDALASGRTQIDLLDGRRFEHGVTEALGHPARPLDDAALAKKFRACALHAEVPMPAAAVERLIEAVFTIEQAPDAGRALFGPVLS